MIARARALEPPVGDGLIWRDALRLSLLARLAELIDVPVLTAPGRSWPEPVAGPVFFGPHRAEGAVPLAELCDEICIGSVQGSGDD